MAANLSCATYDSFKSSYRQYKHDSDVVAHWLATTATRLGYSKTLLKGTSGIPSKAAATATATAPAPAPATGRLKGRARKIARDVEETLAKAQASNASDTAPAKAANKYVIAVKDFTALADWIVSHKPAPRVPASFFKVIERAIFARKEHQSWWTGEASSLSASDTDGEDGHAYFIGILEAVRDILGPLRQVADATKGRDDSASHGQATHKRKSHDETVSAGPSFTNKFEALHLDDDLPEAEDGELCANQETKSNAPAVQFAADTRNMLSEAQCAFCLVLKDLNEMRSYLKAMWSTLGTPQFNLIAAALATDAAVDLVRQLEEEYDQDFGEHLNLDTNIQLQYKTACLFAGQDPDATQRQSDAMNFAVWSRAERSLYPVWLVLNAIQLTVKASAQPMIAHPPPMPERSSNPRKSPRQSFHDNNKLLVEMTPEISVFACRGYVLPAEDRLTAGLRKVFKGQELTLWTVFATQIFFDIHEECGGKVTIAYNELVKTAKIVEPDVLAIQHFQASVVDIAHPDRRNERLFLQSILDDIQECILSDVGATTRAALYPSGTDPKHRPLKPFNFVKNHPWYCGLLAYNIRARLERAALWTMNASGSILFAAHLYNAVTKEGLLSRKWEFMERAILAYKEESFFVGGRSQSSGEYIRRLLLALGYSARNFASDRKPNKRLAKFKKPKRKLETISPIHEMFLERHTQYKDRLHLSVQDLNILVNNMRDTLKSRGVEEPVWSHPMLTFDARVIAASTHAEEESMQPQPVQSNRSEGIAPMVNTTGGKDVVFELIPATVEAPKGEKLYPVQLISSIYLGIVSEANGFTADHIGLHLGAWLILCSVKEAVSDELRSRLGSGSWEDDANLAPIVEYILRVNAQESYRGGPRGVSKMLRLAAAAMEVMLDELEGGDEAE